MQETLGWVGAWAVTTKVPMILDCDPGHDDAIAIVVAARHADLLGITTVAGNAPLDRTTHNALVVRDLLGIDTPVHAGAPGRCSTSRTPRRSSTAPAGSTVPTSRPDRPLDGTDAVAFIVETCRAPGHVARRRSVR